MVLVFMVLNLKCNGNSSEIKVTGCRVVKDLKPDYRQVEKKSACNERNRIPSVQAEYLKKTD